MKHLTPFALGLGTGLALSLAFSVLAAPLQDSERANSADPGATSRALEEAPPALGGQSPNAAVASLQRADSLPTPRAEPVELQGASRAKGTALLESGAGESSPGDLAAGAAAEPKRDFEAELKQAELKGALNASRVEQLSERIRALTRKRLRTPDLVPDGRVTSLDRDLATATIDLGWNQGLTRHMRFRAYRLAPKAKRLTVAVLRVERVEAAQAHCMILQEVRVWNPETGERSAPLPRAETPVEVGDLLHNPYFDPRGRRNLVVLGDITKGSHTPQQIRERLQELGGTVQDHVQLSTNYVVLLDDPRANEAVREQVELASLFGATFLTEERALEYLGLAPYPVSEFR